MDNNQKVLGNSVQVVFVSLGEKAIHGKVDTGATTSSLDAQDIGISKSTGQKTVRFRCPALSNNFIELPMEGAQEVHSADAGGTTRPMVSMDISINGTMLRDVSFNLNDRSGMDTPVLIGQNALQAGNFIIDPNKDVEAESQTAEEIPQDVPTRESVVLRAIEVLAENDVTLNELFAYMQKLEK